MNVLHENVGFLSAKRTTERVNQQKRQEKVIAMSIPIKEQYQRDTCIPANPQEASNLSRELTLEEIKTPTNM